MRSDYSIIKKEDELYLGCNQNYTEKYYQYWVTLQNGRQLTLYLIVGNGSGEKWTENHPHIANPV